MIVAILLQGGRHDFLATMAGTPREVVVATCPVPDSAVGGRGDQRLCFAHEFIRQRYRVSQRAVPACFDRVARRFSRESRVWADRPTSERHRPTRLDIALSNGSDCMVTGH